MEIECFVEGLDAAVEFSDFEIYDEEE